MKVAYSLFALLGLVAGDKYFCLTNNCSLKPAATCNANGEKVTSLTGTFDVASSSIKNGNPVYVALSSSDCKQTYGK